MIDIDIAAAAAAAKSLQSCLSLCDSIDGSPPGSPGPGILQARTLEWVAIAFSNAWNWKVKVKSLSPVWLFATPWTAAYQAPPTMGFSRQECWSGVPSPSPKHGSNIPKLRESKWLLSGYTTSSRILEIPSTLLYQFISNEERHFDIPRGSGFLKTMYLTFLKKELPFVFLSDK